MNLDTSVSELARPLLRYAIARTGSLTLAEDLAQEALTALVSRWRRIGPPDSPTAFAFSIVRRRAGRARMRGMLLEPLERLFGVPDPNHEPDLRAEINERVAAVRKSLGCLSHGEREALLLVAWGGLTMAEAGAVLKLSPSAMKMRLHRARLRLRDELEPEYEAI